MRLILLKNLSGKKATVKKTTSDVFPDHSNRLQTKLARKNYRHFSYIFAHLQEWGVLQQNRDCHILSRRWSAGAVSRLWPRYCSNHARCPRVPMLSRSAIHASGIVVCERNSQASSIFPGSPFRRALRAASLQPIRCNPSTPRRSACAASASCTTSPKWLGPGGVSTCSRQKRYPLPLPSTINALYRPLNKCPNSLCRRLKRPVDRKSTR